MGKHRHNNGTGRPGAKMSHRGRAVTPLHGVFTLRVVKIKRLDHAGQTPYPLTWPTDTHPQIYGHQIIFADQPFVRNQPEGMGKTVAA